MSPTFCKKQSTFIDEVEIEQLRSPGKNFGGHNVKLQAQFKKIRMDSHFTVLRYIPFHGLV